MTQRQHDELVEKLAVFLAQGPNKNQGLSSFNTETGKIKNTFGHNLRGAAGSTVGGLKAGKSQLYNFGKKHPGVAAGGAGLAGAALAGTAGYLLGRRKKKKEQGTTITVNASEYKDMIEKIAKERNDKYIKMKISQ